MNDLENNGDVLGYGSSGSESSQVDGVGRMLNQVLLQNGILVEVSF